MYYLCTRLTTLCHQRDYFRRARKGNSVVLKFVYVIYNNSCGALEHNL